MSVPVLHTAPTADLGQTGLHQLRAFLDGAYAGDFSDDDWSHALGGVHVLARLDGHLVGHAAVVVRQLVVTGRTLRTGYVEAVATAAQARRQGIGTALMAEVERLVHGGFEVGALSASADGVPLYERRGWLRWTGDTAAQTPDGVRDTPGEQIFVLPTEATPAPLQTDGRLVCDWRRGDLW